MYQNLFWLSPNPCPLCLEKLHRESSYNEILKSSPLELSVDPFSVREQTQLLVLELFPPTPSKIRKDFAEEEG